jgi:hypothetical protein
MTGIRAKIRTLGLSNIKSRGLTEIQRRSVVVVVTVTTINVANTKQAVVLS